MLSEIRSFLASPASIREFGKDVRELSSASHSLFFNGFSGSELKRAGGYSALLLFRFAWLQSLYVLITNPVGSVSESWGSSGIPPEFTALVLAEVERNTELFQLASLLLLLKDNLGRSERNSEAIPSPLQVWAQCYFFKLRQLIS